MSTGPGRWSTENPGNRAIHAERSRLAVRALRRAGLWPVGDRRVLDVGCGEGHGLSDLAEAGVSTERAVGVDPDGDRLGRARRRLPGVPVVEAAGGTLPFPDGRFDVVVVFTLFSSIADEGRANRVAFEIERVLRPGGAVLWYDMRHPNPRNPATHAVSRRRVGELFPRLAVDVEPVTVVPPLARHLGTATDTVYPALAHVPGLPSHLLGVLRKMPRK